jgi:CRISPR-associated protein Cas2
VCSWVAYDIATLLSGYGPRVQLSVFECELASKRDAAALRARLRQLIDHAEDQIRLYPLNERTIHETVVLGARVIEERQDFWTVRWPPCPPPRYTTTARACRRPRLAYGVPAPMRSGLVKGAWKIKPWFSGA